MSEGPASNASVQVSASASEKSARSPALGRAPASKGSKSRSCVVCRSRKVRCDKQSPACSNCRRANIACVFPSDDRPPRWARGLVNNATISNSSAPEADDQEIRRVMERLQNLENLVKELSSQLKESQAANSSVGGSSSGVCSPDKFTTNFDAGHQREMSPASDTTGVDKKFGRLVVQNVSGSRYVSSGFWSRINDELNGLRMDSHDIAENESDSSEDEASSEKSPPTLELERTPTERHAFLFRHNMDSSNPSNLQFQPLPSQILFLFEVFSENVNFIIQAVHLQTVSSMIRDLRGDMTRLTPVNEALLFSIYYAAITSMEEDDVMSNFGSSKTDLNLKYRLGFEHALAKADFLNSPDIILVQALIIFLCLARRHDSPRFVWMMTGIVIRMAQYLGLQRDGSNFEQLTPYEVEMRRRVWWGVCMLDLRASEDQGTELAIANGSFDTRIPLNINNADITPESREIPVERHGLTDMSMGRCQAGLLDTMRQLMASAAKDDTASVKAKSRMLSQIYQKYEEGFLQYIPKDGNIEYWVGVTVARLVMAKMTLIVFLPVLFTSPSQGFSDELRAKLLISAIEVAEYNHALNAEQECRKWRWIYQTYTHWHSIVYLMIEASRSPWSPMIERAYVALHSSWLIPNQNSMDRNLRIWVPLRKLMAKVRKHREAELDRLRADPEAAFRLEREDQEMPTPSSSSALSSNLNETSAENFLRGWRQLVAMPVEFRESTYTSGVSRTSFSNPLMSTDYFTTPAMRSVSTYDPENVASLPPYPGVSAQLNAPAMTAHAFNNLISSQTAEPTSNPFPPVSIDWSGTGAMGLGGVPWLWADPDPSIDVSSDLDMNMELDGEIDWYSWVQSATGLE